MNKEVEEFKELLKPVNPERLDEYGLMIFKGINVLLDYINQLEEENRKLINNKYDTIYLIQDLACYDRETNSYCNSIKYYDVHKIIEELKGGSNE